MYPVDAIERGLDTGNLVIVWNQRGKKRLIESVFEQMEISNESKKTAQQLVSSHTNSLLRRIVSAENSKLKI